MPGLNLRSGGAVTYEVHPVVVFSILDHYKRRTDGQHRVIGTLLGEVDEVTNVCHIKNCFPVPHQETEDDVALDLDYHTNMLRLNERVAPSEKVVGWYSTGDQLNYVSSLMHEVYKSQLDEPVLVTVDVNVTKFNKMALKAYVGNVVKYSLAPSMARFEPVTLDVTAFEGEKIAIDALINGNPDGSGFDAPATILSDMENLDNSLSKLHSLLETVSEYCAAVQEGKQKGDPRLGQAISHLIAAVPHLDGEAFEDMFTNKIQDLLMVLYLTNVTRTHVALADRINGLL